jgi:NTP-dependent ternary system trypsin peptidase co-occuring protein
VADTGDGQDDDGLGLDEVLAALRHDLLAAQRASGGENSGLAVREVQIELSVEVTRHVDAKGEVGAKWFVLSGSASGGGSRDRTSTNRVTLTLGPVTPGPGEEAPTTGEPVAGSDVSPGVIPRAVAENPPDHARRPVT